MKKTVIFFLLSFLVLASYSKEEHRKDNSIVGKWEYVKTILPDGSKVIDLIATEHYYSDGTLLFVNVWLNPQPVNEFSKTTEEIKNNLKSAYGAIGTYSLENGKEKDKLTYNIVTSTRMKDMGKSNSVDIKVDKDTLIFFFNNGNQIIMQRVTNK